MLQMGFIGHHYGIESTNPETLKLIGKGMHPDRLLPGILDARKYFKSHSLYRATATFIVGLPKETQESWQKTKLWILRNWQGESSNAYPLYIPEGPIQTPSLLTEHWSKYGYRKSDSNYFDQVNQAIQQGQANSKLVHLLHEGAYVTADLKLKIDNPESTDSGLNWENDHWSRLSATVEVANWLDIYHPYDTPNPWNVGQWMLAMRQPRSFFMDKTNAEVNASLYKTTGLLADAKANIIAKEYILNKLNWRGGPGTSCTTKPKKSASGV
jgi:hypothetical protein